MGGKSSSQTIGYRYFASVMTHLGSRIETVLGVNFDKRYWFMNENNEPSMHVDNICLYGESEGGVHGMIDIHVGTPNQLPNSHYLQYDPLASGYPDDSYLVLRGDDGDSLSFYHGNTNTMREMLVWPKRTRVQNDGSAQWYIQRSSDNAIVCEIQAIGNDCAYVSGYYTEPLWYFNDAATAISNSWTIDSRSVFWSAGGSGKLTLKFGIKTAKRTTVLSRTIYATEGVSSISSETHQVFVTEESLSGATWKKSYTLEVVVNPSFDEQEVVIDFDGSFTIGASGDTGFFVEFGRPAPESGYFCERIDGVDINPIHKIREILTNPSPWGMNKPEIDINDENFKKAANRIYDEGLGISWAVNNKNCVDAINELCYHTESGARINRQTGQYEIVLFRNDWFDEDEIHTLPESKIKSIKPESKSIEDIYNQVNVSFYNREEIKNGAFSIADVGLIKTVGNVITSDVKFPYFQNFRNAEKVAQWKLKQLSTGTWSGSFTTGYKEARKWNRYDLLWLEWSRKWSSPILVRIMSIGLGTATNSTVTIEFEEVVQHSNMGGFITFDPSENTGVQPPQQNNHAVFEVPYYLLVMAMGQRVVDEELAYNSDYGIVGAIAEKPQNNSLYAILQTNDGTGWNDRASTVDYVERAELVNGIGLLDDVFYVSKLPSAVGELALIGNEWVVVESIDPLNSSITVKRGALDTIPVARDANSEIFYSGTYFAYDAREYQDGDEILAQVLTTTPSGMEKPAGEADAVEMYSRAIRPYPPANVKFNGSYFPESVLIAGGLVLTWAHRNRVQQTSSEPLGWYEPSVTLEDGVTYSLELSTTSGVLVSESGLTTDTYSFTEIQLQPNKAHTLKLWSVRDGYDSYQIFEHNFFVESASLILTATATSTNVTGNTVPLASISADVDESLKANVMYDGNSVIGKAEPNATIEIEVDE